jgi:acetyl-CoA acyltransferase
MGVTTLPAAFGTSNPTLAWATDTGADLAKTNVNGAAIAVGHPLGASGARVMTTMVNALEQGGGMANATLIERLG